MVARKDRAVEEPENRIPELEQEKAGNRRRKSVLANQLNLLQPVQTQSMDYRGPFWRHSDVEARGP